MNGSFRLPVLIALCSAASFVPPAEAADRMRPGQWAGTTVAGGKTFPTLSCISQADAEAINGDAKAVQGYLEKIIPPESCQISNVKEDGGKIVYSASCYGQPPKIVTTDYHGTSFEVSDSRGSKTEAKLVGVCK